MTEKNPYKDDWSGAWMLLFAVLGIVTVVLAFARPDMLGP